MDGTRAPGKWDQNLSEEEDPKKKLRLIACANQNIARAIRGHVVWSTMIACAVDNRNKSSAGCPI